MNLYFSCVTLRLRAFALKGFYRMPSLPGGLCFTSKPTGKSDESKEKGFAKREALSANSAMCHFALPTHRL